MLIIQDTETKYKVPNFMILDNVIKYKLYNDELYLKQYGVPIADCKDVMTYEEMKALNNKINGAICNNYNITDTKLDLQTYYSNFNIDKDIINEILTHTYFERVCEEWNITDICRKYNITGEEVFIALCNHKPVKLYSEDNGYECYDEDNNSDPDVNDKLDTDNLETEDNYYSKANLTKLFNESKAKSIKTKYDTVYFDYIRGQGVKNHFPIDVYDTKFVLNMRRFNSRSSHNGYDRVLELFVEKIKTAKVYDFKSELASKYTEAEQLALDNIKNLDILQELNNSIKSNNEIIKDYSHLDYYNSGYNWRARYYTEFKYTKDKYSLTDKDATTYDLEPYYNKYFKDNLDDLDLAQYFKLESINTVFDNEIKKTHRYVNKYCIDYNKISIVNLLLFSKSRINYESLDYILELVRIKYIPDYNCNGLQLDNYIVKHYLTDNPKYSSVEFKVFDERDTGTMFARTLNDKTQVARYFVTVAQEYPTDVINLHNLNMMFLYKENNEYHSSLINSVITIETNRLNNVRAVD